MKQNYVKIIIGLLSFCLAGILAFQIYWITDAYNVKEEQFNRLVSESLNNISEKLEDSEAAFLFANTLDKFDTSIANIPVPPVPPLPPDIIKIKKNHKDSIKKTITISSTVSDSNVCINNSNGKGRFNMSFCEGDDSVIMDFSESGFSFSISSDDERGDINLTTKLDSALKKLENKLNHQINNKKIKKLDKRSEWMTKVVNKMVLNWEIKDFPTEKRIQAKKLAKVIKKELNNNGIFTPYEFAVVSKKSKKISTVKSKGFKPDFINSGYKVDLFQRDYLKQKDQLVLNFPGKRKFIMTGLSAMMFVQILFTIIIIMTFTGSILLIVRQKKLSDIKNDFINNMTHEFKTPIATIGIAVDSINNPKILDDKDMIVNFTKIIREENNRMNDHVETILRMALLDKNELSMNFQIINVHDILQQAVSKIKLQVESREGVVLSNFNAENDSVNADSVHIMNTFINILDNANKYSKDKPEITVSTRNNENEIIIAIEDKGIGMSKDTAGMIFEKFYRAPTGNIHNVKGFGLGLSYAKAVIDLHKGQIKLTSEQGQGSTFEIILPNV